ncbi:MAG: HIT domain-containing protein [Candidatus Nezhaarchaeales archaeon]
MKSTSVTFLDETLKASVVLWRFLNGMRRLWAPWRMEYIKSINEKPKGCIFCEKAKEADDEKNLIVYRGSEAFIMLNAYPYNSGHLMVAPYRHTPSLTDLNDQELLNVFKLVNLGIKALTLSMKPEGFNVGVNIGRAAGAGVAEHVHVHVVPRWAGDTNFMPVIGEVKVLPELLRNTWLKVREALNSLTLCRSRSDLTL